MTYVLAGLLALSLVLLLVERRDSRAALEREVHAARDERGELLSRIQRPEYIPALTRDVEPWEAPDDELALVGAIIPADMEEDWDANA